MPTYEHYYPKKNIWYTSLLWIFALPAADRIGTSYYVNTKLADERAPRAKRRRWPPCSPLCGDSQRGEEPTITLGLMCDSHRSGRFDLSQYGCTNAAPSSGREILWAERPKTRDTKIKKLENSISLS